jgi:PPM family protein phosphatase
MIPAERAHLSVTAVSHPGMTRKNNEDRYAVSAYTTPGEHTLPSVLAVIADGIGGHRAGEVAAEIAVETISADVASSDASQPVQTLREAIVHAGHAISEMAATDPELQGMGSTCACAWVIGWHLYTAAVGDTRIYLIRENSIHQLTTDHTWVQEAIEHGVLAPEEARKHPNAHVIRRFLGSKQEVIPDARLHLRAGESDAQAETNQGTQLHPGDILVMCSDGLTDLVNDNEILSTLRTRNNRGALEDLVKQSNRRGGHDNVTIITLAVPAIESPTIPVKVHQSKRSKRRLVPLLAAAGLLGLIAIALLGGAIWALLRPGAEVTPAAATQPSQATLFPEAATQPAVTTPAAGTPAAPTTQPAGSDSSMPFVTPLSATLTPWPTNTGGP